MKEHERKVIEAMLAAVSEMNDFEMGYFLGYAEAKAQEAERKKSADADKDDGLRLPRDAELHEGVDPGSIEGR